MNNVNDTKYPNNKGRRVNEAVTLKRYKYFLNEVNIFNIYIDIFSNASITITIMIIDLTFNFTFKIKSPLL